MQPTTTRFHTFDGPVVLQGGGELPEVTLAYEVYGELNEDRSNAILVFHAITGSQHAAGFNPTVEGVEDLWQEEIHLGWWDGFVGPGRAFDTDRYAVICVNYLGGCYGSTGYRSIDPQTGRPYGSSFPDVTMTDIVDTQARLLTDLGITNVAAVSGGSVGGMMASIFAMRYPDRVDVVIPIASGFEVTSLHALHNFEQSYAITCDPGYQGGDFYPDTGPTQGLALARMIGHKTFVSLTTLIDRARRDVLPAEQLGGFEVGTALESYMLHHAQKFVHRFDANTYLMVMRIWSQFVLEKELDADRRDLLSGCSHQRWQVLSIDSDVCFYPDEQQAMVADLKAAGVPVRWTTIHSEKGHDSFLTEPHLFEALIREAIIGWSDLTVADPGSR